MRELFTAAARWDIWMALAWSDTKGRYRRTAIGPFWLTLSTGITIGSVGLVYARLFHIDISDYLPYLGIGLIVWAFVSTAITEGCNVFISAAGYIKSVPLPLPMHVYRMLARNAIILAHNSVLVAVLWLIFRWTFGADILLVVAGFAIDSVALFGCAMTLGILCVRFRDIPQIVVSLITLLFLLTPVMWSLKTVNSAELALIVRWNPAYYLLEVLRGPLLGQTPPLDVWLIALGIAVAALVTSVVLFRRMGHRVAYWL